MKQKATSLLRHASHRRSFRHRIGVDKEEVPMTQYEEIDAESYADGWRMSLQEAIDAALFDPEVSVGEAREVDVILGRKKNPHHEYKAILR
jgi:hypothetical protein